MAQGGIAPPLIPSVIGLLLCFTGFLRRLAVAIPPPKPSVYGLLPRLRDAAGVLIYVVCMATLSVIRPYGLQG